MLGKTLFIEVNIAKFEFKLNELKFYKKKIDFPDVVHRKFNLIKSNENLLSLCPGLVKLKEVNENIGNKTKLIQILTAFI